MLAACLDLGVVCDVGSGDGALMGLLAPCCQEMYCLEPSAAMRAAATTTLSQWPQCRQLAGHGEAIPLADNSVDCVLSLQSLQYTQHPAQKYWHEAQRILRPGGRLLLLTLAVLTTLKKPNNMAIATVALHPATLQQWCDQLEQWRCYPQAAESRPPHFVSLLASGLSQLPVSEAIAELAATPRPEPEWPAWHQPHRNVHYCVP